MVEIATPLQKMTLLVGFLPRSTSKMTREETEDARILQAFPFPFPMATKKTLTMMMKMKLLTMMKKKKTSAPDPPKKHETDAPATDAPATATATVAEDDEETKKTKMKMKQDDKEDKEKKKMEEAPALKDPDNDIGDPPIENPGEPKEEGNSFHLPSPTALHLQGPFPGG
jgi:hypothetical protein